MSPRWIEKGAIPTLRTQRSRTGRWTRPFRLKVRDAFVLHRRGLAGQALGESDLEQRAVSHDKVKGSLPERIIYKELLKRQIEFDFQPSIEGGRLQLGGMVADFILQDRPLIIRVQGSTWHTPYRAEQKDESQKMYMEAMGYIVVDIWDWEIANDDLREAWFERNIDVGIPQRRAV